MLLRLPPEKYAGINELFTELSFNIQIPSILGGNSLGEVFVDSIHAPCCALIWDKLATIYLAGNHAHPEFYKPLCTWVIDTAIPQAQAIGFPTLTVQYTSGGWVTRLRNLVPRYPLYPKQRRYYTHPLEMFPSITIPPDYQMQRIDRQLLQDESRGNLDWLRSWINSFWHSLQDFLRIGFGYCLIYQDRTIASFCFSVFVYESFFELATATQNDHQSRDLSSIATIACLKSCRDQGCQPVWHCWDDNPGSIGVARKAGFELDKVYSVLQVGFNPQEDRQ